MAGVPAAGAVILRRRGARTEVAVIHRPRYDDWSLPKGKLEPRESLPACAVRETREETGLDVRLDVVLDVVRYRPPKGDRKEVHYWRASVADEHPLRSRGEADEVRWIDAEGTLRRLSFARDRRLVRQAVHLPETTPVALVRHGKAMTRKRWKGGPDVQRPLVRRGQQQARDVVPVLSAWGITDLRSSAGTRCVQTLEPAARKFGVPLATYELLTEEVGVPRPEAVTALMGELSRRAALTGRPWAVCGHRPVIPAMLAGMGVEARPMGTGDVVVAHLTGDGRAIAVEHHGAVR